MADEPVRPFSSWTAWALFTPRMLVDRADELLHRERLADVVLDAEELGVGAVAASLVAGDHDRRDQAAGAALELLQHEEAALLGHHHVQDDQVGVLPLGDGQAGVTVAGDQNAIAPVLEDHAHRLDDLEVVVDQEDCLGRHGHERSPSPAGIVEPAAVLIIQPVPTARQGGRSPDHSDISNVQNSFLGPLRRLGAPATSREPLPHGVVLCA